MTVCVLFEFKFCFHVMNASFRVELLSVCLRPISGVRKNFFGRVPVAHQARVCPRAGAEREQNIDIWGNGKWEVFQEIQAIINIHQFYQQICHLLPRKPIFMNFMRRARVAIDFFTGTGHFRLNIDQILLGEFRGSMGCGASEMDTAEFSCSRSAWLLQHEQLAELFAYLQLVG
jgi:hypothetical protein